MRRRGVEGGGGWEERRWGRRSEEVRKIGGEDEGKSELGVEEEGRGGDEDENKRGGLY